MDPMNFWSDLSLNMYDKKPLPSLGDTRKKMNKFLNFTDTQHVARISDINPSTNCYTFTPYTQHFESYEALMHYLRMYFELEPIKLEIDMSYRIQITFDPKLGLHQYVPSKDVKLRLTQDGLYSEVFRNRIRLQHDNIIAKPHRYVSYVYKYPDPHPIFKVIGENLVQFKITLHYDGEPIKA